MTVNFNCSDALSGIETCPASRGVSTEGSGQTVTETAADKAGNSETVRQAVNIDLIKPGISFNGTCPATVNLKAAATVDISITDNLSGVASQSAPNGTNALDTSTVGEKTFTVTAQDNAGNSNSSACTYRVIYDFTGSGGFSSPMKNPPYINTTKAGSAVPVKWQLPDGSGGYISDLSVVGDVFFQQVQCQDFANVLQNEVPVDTSGNSCLRYDPDTNQYIYTWKTDGGMAGKCYVLILRLNDGSEYKANFQLK